MKKLIPLFSSTLFFTISHIICCLLPYVALGLVSLPLYLSFFTHLQPYIFTLQLMVLLYNFHYLYFRRKKALTKAKIVFWATLFISIFAFLFPYYRHAQAQKNNSFGKSIIQNLK